MVETELPGGSHFTRTLLSGHVASIWSRLRLAFTAGMALVPRLDIQRLRQRDASFSAPHTDRVKHKKERRWSGSRSERSWEKESWHSSPKPGKNSSTDRWIEHQSQTLYDLPSTLTSRSSYFTTAPRRTDYWSHPQSESQFYTLPSTLNNRGHSFSTARAQRLDGQVRRTHAAPGPKVC